MEFAIGSTVSALFVDYVPIESVNVKIALVSLITSLIGLLLRQSTDFSYLIAFLPACCRHRQKKVHIDVCDWSTARAISKYLDLGSRDEEEVKIPDSLEWHYDRLVLHDDVPTEVVFQEHKMQIIKHTSRFFDKEETKRLTNDETKIPENAYLRISSNASADIICNFIRHVQSKRPFSLFVHRQGFLVESHATKQITSSIEDEEEHNATSASNDRFSNVFFAALERYFLQEHRILCANVGFMDNETVLGAEPDTFERSILKDTFEGQTVSISFLFHDSDKASWTKTDKRVCHQVNCLLVESDSLQVVQLREYLDRIFDIMATRESDAMLQKAIRVYEVQFKGHKDVSAQWQVACTKTTKSFRNTIISETVQVDFIDDLRRFLDSPERYVSCGQPYKRGYVLHGPPGTGKSSLIKAAAREHGLPVFLLNLSTMTCAHFETLIADMNRRTRNKPHVLAMEDVDRCRLLLNNSRYCHRRGRLGGGESSSEDDEDARQDDEDNANPKTKKLTMGALLNVLDGVKEPYGRITIFTGNNSKKFTQPNKRLEAFLRSGRIDRIVEIGFCTPSQIQRIYKLHYPQEEELELIKIRHFEKLKPALVGELFMQIDGQKAKNIMYGLEPFVANGKTMTCKKIQETNELLDEKHIEDEDDDTQSTRKATTTKAAIKAKKLPSVREVKRAKQELDRNMKRIDNVIMDGDAQAFVWHEKCRKWLDILNAKKASYTQQFVERVIPNGTDGTLLTGQVPTLTKKGRPRKKKVASATTSRQPPIEDVNANRQREVDAKKQEDVDAEKTHIVLHTTTMEWHNSDICSEPMKPNDS